MRVNGGRDIDKSVISTPDLRLNLFKLLAIMEVSELAIEYHHFGKIFRLKSYPTGKTYKRTRKSRSQINPLTIQTAKCPDCSGLSISGVCFNDNCQRSKIVR